MTLDVGGAGCTPASRPAPSASAGEPVRLRVDPTRPAPLRPQRRRRPAYDRPAARPARRARLRPVPVTLLADATALAQPFADAILGEYRNAKQRGRETVVMIVPVPPVGQYDLLAARCNKERIALADLLLIGMDEYLGPDGDWIAEDDPLSFRGHVKRRFWDVLDPALAPAAGAPDLPASRIGWTRSRPLDRTPWRGRRVFRRRRHRRPPGLQRAARARRKHRRRPRSPQARPGSSPWPAKPAPSTRSPPAAAPSPASRRAASLSACARSSPRANCICC